MHDSPLVRSLITGLTAFRVACLVWLVAILVATRQDVDRTWAAVVLVGAATVVTVVWSLRLRTEGATALLGRKPLAIDVGVAAALAVGDGVVFDGPHSLSLGSSWPLTSVLSVAIGWGARSGAAAGVVVGIANAVGDALEGSTWTFGEILSRTSTLFLYTMAGAMAGYASRRLIAAEEEIALTRARDEVARTLHDGVLQTLAAVQRRSDDEQLADLAREQERELREYLFGVGVADGGGDLGAAIRHVTARAERRDRTTIRVVMAPDVPDLGPATVEAVAGAVGEACTNAAKHGGARVITVYAEPSENGVLCSVKDDGQGFDPSTTDEGIGTTQSIRGRILDVGGSVEIDPNPGRGTEVRISVPIRSGRRSP
ncbi:ATP-binding protein [Actinospongicola halichondriae]|uniref:ATP-binding protein n=1 Tax=Actinospongicola halichondriae TaxID=3236844 RepID=UPI003D401B8F